MRNISDDKLQQMADRSAFQPTDQRHLGIDKAHVAGYV